MYDEGSHYSETTMPERTSPTDALERLSWHLNYHQGETISLNQLANSTGLSWATVRKYVQAIEKQQKIAPQIASEEDGITVGRRSQLLAELFEDEQEAVALYILINARANGDATAPISTDTHASVLTRYTEVIEEMAESGLIERQDGEINLTPKGVRIAGPRSGEISGADRNVNSTSASIRKYQHGGEIIITWDDLSETSPSEQSTTASGFSEEPEKGEEGDYTRTGYSQASNFAQATD